MAQTGRPSPFMSLSKIQFGIVAALIQSDRYVHSKRRLPMPLQPQASLALLPDWQLSSVIEQARL
jgi:hypothetical protein